MPGSAVALNVTWSRRVDGRGRGRAGTVPRTLEAGPEHKGARVAVVIHELLHPLSCGGGDRHEITAWG